MPVFRCDVSDINSSNGAFLTSLFDDICKEYSWCDSRLYNLVRNNLSFDFKTVSWRSVNYDLNPMYSVQAVSKAAKENRAGVSPLGSNSSVKPYMIPVMNYDVNYTDIFIIINPYYFGIIQPKRGFIIVGLIKPETLNDDYVYVYASGLTFSSPLDTRIANFNATDKFFMCFPVDSTTFHGADEHNLYVSVESYKSRQSMQLQVGVDKNGNPIYAPFAFDKGVLNFDTCILSNAVPDGINIPNERHFINETKMAHPRNVNTLNDISNIKTIDIFVRDGDRPTLYKFFSHIDHLSYCSSYNFTYWYATKVDYPVRGKKWFLWDVYSDVPYHGLALLVDYHAYFSATELDSNVSISGIDINHKIDYTCNFSMPDNIYGIDLAHVHDYNHNYGGFVPNGAIVIAEYSPTYMIFFGDSSMVVWRRLKRSDLVEYAENSRTYTVYDTDNGFSITFSFYSGMWNVLVPISHNCVIFDIYRYSALQHGGDFGVISSVQ